MDTLVQAFLIARQADGCTPKTLRHYRISLKNLSEWLSAEGLPRDPHEWDTTLLRQFVLHLQDKKTPSGKPLSGYSVTTYVQAVKTFVKWLYDEDLIDNDIGARLKKPRPPQTQKQPYSDDELRRFLAVSKPSPRDHAIISILIDCGLRANEVCQLTKEDVNFDQFLIIVRQGKGRKTRVVPMSPLAARAIMKHIAKNEPVHFLFATRDHETFTPNSLLQLVRRLGAKAEVPNPTVHRFRHSFALAWVRSGSDILTLSKVLGHSDPNTTRMYVFLATEDLQRTHINASPLQHLKHKKK